MGDASARTAADENHPTAAGAPAGTKDEPQPPTRGALVEEAARVAATLNDKLPSLSDDSPAHGNRKAAPEREREPPRAREEREPPRVREEKEAGFGAHVPPPRPLAGGESVAESAAGTTAAAAQAETRGRVGRRAATVGASVSDNLRPRVEKLREASTVVLDEASDDPGLRFVIIAVVLFLLFLFILLFSYMLG
jgi:hypothetical protein